MLMNSIILLGILDDIASRIASINDLVSNPVTSSLSPFVAVFGTLFYLIVWFFLEGMIYLKTNSVMIVATTSFIFATLYSFMFFEHYIIYRAITFLMAIALAGLLYRVFVKEG